MRVPGRKDLLSLWPAVAITLLTLWAGVSFFVSSPLGWIGVSILAAVVLLFALPLIQLDRLEHEAHTDVKTGLWNARQFSALYAIEMDRCKRFNRRMAVLMIDLDLLREVNNKYGHLAGDEVLAGIGKTLRSSVRGYDIVGRFGGEEFAIVLPEANVQQAFKLAERLRQAIAALRYRGPGGTYFQVTASFGVASFPDDGHTLLELLEAADRAVYAAKANGRNCTAVATDAHPTEEDAIHAHQDAERFESLAAVGDRMDPSPMPFSARSLLPAAIAAAVCIVLLVSGGVTADRTLHALPGDGLYPLKLAYRQAQLAVTADPASRAVTALSVGRERLNEIKELAAAGRYSDIPDAARRYLAAGEMAWSLAHVLRTQDPGRWSELARQIESELAENYLALGNLARYGSAPLQLALADLIRAFEFELGQAIGTSPGAIAQARAGIGMPPAETAAVDSDKTGSDLALLIPTKTGASTTSVPVLSESAPAVGVVVMEFELGSVSRDKPSAPDMAPAPAEPGLPTVPPPPTVQPAKPPPSPPPSVEPPPPSDEVRVRGNSANAPGHNKDKEKPPPKNAHPHPKNPKP